MTAERRYQNFFEIDNDLFNQVPLQYIASMLGMTAETFSRIRKKNYYNFLIFVKSKTIIVLDLCIVIKNESNEVFNNN